MCFNTSRGQSFLDPTFGTGGIVITPEPTGSLNYFTSLIIQPGNKIVAGGSAVGGAILLRYNANGTVDSTFAFGAPFPGYINKLLQQPDGKIIALGQPTYRFSSDGVLETTFGSGGIDSSIQGEALTLQPDGKIVVAGETPSAAIVVSRVLPNGTPDSTFGINGKITTASWMPVWAYGYARAVAVQPDGKIVVGCQAALGRFMAIRCLADGSPDTTFNHTGVTISTAGGGYNSCRAMLLQADGKIVLGGSGDFDPGGSIDRTYGDTGVANIDFNMDEDDLRALTEAPNGKIFATGCTHLSGHWNFDLTCINTNGLADSSFGINGRISTAVSDSLSTALAIATTQDGKIVLGGWGGAGAAETQVTLARYTGFTTQVSQVTNKKEDPVLYPNPAVDALTINDAKHIKNIIVRDVKGDQVPIKEQYPYNEISLTNWVAGVYFFTLTFDDRSSVTKKILIR